MASKDNVELIGQVLAIGAFIILMILGGILFSIYEETSIEIHPDPSYMDEHFNPIGRVFCNDEESACWIEGVKLIVL